MSARCVQPITLRTLIARFTGDANALFPQSVLLKTPEGQTAVLKFTESYALVGIQLTSSIVAFGPADAGLILVIGNEQRNLTISNSINSPISHITAPNSLVGPPALVIPTSKVTSLSFGSFAIPVPSGTPVALYGFMDATAGNDIFAICSLQLVPVR